MRKKLVSIGSLCVMLLLVVPLFMSACSSTTSAPSTTPSTTPTTAATTSSEVFELKFICAAMPPDLQEIFKAWGTEMAERSNGRIKLDYYLSGELGGPPDQLNMLNSGMADIAFCPSAWTPGAFPLSELGEANFFGVTIMENYAYGQYIQGWEKCTEYNDYKVLMIGGVVAQRLAFTKKKLTTFNEFTGTKLRVRALTQQRFVEALGASPVSISTPDLYTALERGVVDGTLTDWDHLRTYTDAVKYAIDTPVGSGIQIVIMSKKVWDSLPCDLQLIVEEASYKHLMKWMYYYLTSEVTGRAEFIEKGGTVYTISDAEFAKIESAGLEALEMVLKDYETKGIPGREAWEAMKVLKTR